MERVPFPLQLTPGGPDPKSHRLIHNLSDLILTDDMVSLLHKGLSFIPTPKFIPYKTLRDQHLNFTRNIKIIDFFDHFGPFNSGKFRNKVKTKFTGPSNWTPAPSEISTEGNQLLKSLDANFNSLSYTNTFLNNKITDNSDAVLKTFYNKNLTNGETRALADLKKNSNIIIKPADKGGGIVILNLAEYKREAYRQLLNTEYYVPLYESIQLTTAMRIKNILIDLHINRFLDYKQFLFLCPPISPRPRVFYLLPKIHKPLDSWDSPWMPPGRPIVSNCSSETSKIAEYIDSFLIPISNKHPSYIRNSFELVTKIQNMNIDEHDFLITADISALYTNMENSITIAAVKEQFLKYPDSSRPDSFLINLLELILTSNDFVFDGKIYKQIKGCSMGLNCSPSLANIFLINFDDQAMNGFKIKPLIFFRYLDDIFSIFRGSLVELEEYKIYLNSLIPNIKLTFTHSMWSIDFLDVTIFKLEHNNNFTLQTKIFFKKTDSHQLLHTSSFHPQHIFSSIIYSQILRFKRISSFKTDFDKTCAILFSSLKDRGYSKFKLKNIKRRVWFDEPVKVGRTDKTSAKDLPFIVDYCPFGQALSQLHRNTLKHYPLSQKHRLLTAFYNQKNLGNFLIRAKL